MTRSREAFLVQFQIGGVSFAVEAESIVEVADGKWLGPLKEGSRSNLIELAPLLNLPTGKNTRTLIFKGRTGIRGLRAETVTKKLVSQFTLHPVSDLLAGWMKPVILQGVASNPEDDSLLSVLDLKQLEQYVENLI